MTGGTWSVRRRRRGAPPELGLGPGWRALFEALLADGELRDAVEAAATLAGRVAAEQMLRARVPEAFEWADAWQDQTDQSRWRP